MSSITQLSTPKENGILFEGKGIAHQFGTRAILQHIDITLRANEIITIIGPNGSGKTTLVRIILGLLKPEEGSLYKKEGICVGYMPQKLQIDPVLPLTVERFLALSNKKKKPKTPDIKALAEEMGVLHILREQLYDISGGELQRVMLARALLLKPGFLVMDEPVQGLDVQGQAEFYTLIETIRSTRNCGILMVSHDLHMVMATTDHVVCINHHICCEGSPEDVSKNPEYLALFGQKHADTMAVYTHSHDHEHGTDGEVK